MRFLVGLIAGGLVALAALWGFRDALVDGPGLERLWAGLGEQFATLTMPASKGAAIEAGEPSPGLPPQVHQPLARIPPPDPVQNVAPVYAGSAPGTAAHAGAPAPPIDPQLQLRVARIEAGPGDGLDPGAPPGRAAVWVPFYSRVSAHGFADRLSRLLTHRFDVVREGPGRYRVTFDYDTEADREQLLAEVEGITGWAP